MDSKKLLSSLILLGGLSTVFAPAGRTVSAQQAAAPQASASRLVGSITSINGQSLTVKPDSGPLTTVTVSDTARILESPPGAKTIAGATPIHFTDLAVGDRVLIAIHPSPDGSGSVATTVIAMSQADIAKEHQAEEADWQRRGIGGIVKTVDPATGTVTIVHLARSVTIHTSPKTVVRLYDPGSIKFSDTKLSTLDQIHPGDQLRARGDRSADGADMQAEEIVAGSFRNIAGAVVSTDPAAGSVTVTDFATKKPVVIHVNADSQLHQLPAMMAQAIAARFKVASGGASPGQAARGQAGVRKNSRAQDTAHSQSAIQFGTAQPANGQGSPGPAGEGRRGGNISQVLQRTPVIQLRDLHHGDVVMIVATQGTSGSLTVCTLLSGVEPILNASPSAGRNLFSASWNLGGQGASAGAGGGAEGGP